jgi:hypothetical protein
MLARRKRVRTFYSLNDKRPVMENSSKDSDSFRKKIN